MATYIQGLTQYLPQIQPFQRDFNFYANVMQKKQTEYDSGHEAMNKLYGSIFYSDVSRDDMKQRKDELLKAIDFNLKKVSTLDLSLKQNQRQAQQVFRPFYEDKDLMKDIAFTKTYQNEVQRGLAAKECVGKDCPETYWDGGIRLLEHQMNRFKNVSLEEARQMRNPSYTPYFNIMKEGAKLIKENGFEIVRQGPQGGYMVKEKNGPNAIMSFNDFLFQNFSNDPRAIDFYNAKAQLSFYDNPEETINQYELLKLKQRAKDEEDYKNLLQEHKKEKEFNTAKRNINGAAKIAQDNHSRKKKERMVFQDYADQLGELFTNHPAKKDLNEVIRDEETLGRTASELNDLKDNIYGVSYIDGETGQRIPEHVITSVVAQGMLVNETLGVAQSIAMNTYQQTVTGADPYALARYKNRLAKELEEFKTDQQMIRGLFGGTGSSKSKTTGLEIDDKEIEKIRKKVKENNPGLNEQFVEAKVQEEIARQKIEKANEYLDALENAVAEGKLRPQVVDKVRETLGSAVTQTQQLGEFLRIVGVNTADQNWIVKTSSQDERQLNGFAKYIQDYDANNKQVNVDEDGNITKNPITYSSYRRFYENQSASLIEVLNNNQQALDQRNSKIGQHIQTGILNLINPYTNNPENLRPDQKNAMDLIVQKTLDEGYVKGNNLADELAKVSPEKFTSLFIKPKKNISSAQLIQFLADKTKVTVPDSPYVTEPMVKVTEEDFKPQVKTQMWRSLGLSENLLTNLVLNMQEQEKQDKHYTMFNDQNKAALNFVKNDWLNKTGIDRSIIKASSHKDINFKKFDGTYGKEYRMLERFGKSFYNIHSGWNGDRITPKSEMQSLLSYVYPTVETIDFSNGKPVTQISTFDESLEQFINEHIIINKDDNNAQLSKFLHDIMHLRSLNERIILTWIRGYVKEDETFAKNTQEAFSKLSQEAQQKAFTAGLVKKVNDKLYFHDLLIDLTPTDEVKAQVLHNQAKGLATNGSTNNVYGSYYGTEGIHKTKQNDWTNAGLEVSTSIKLNDYDELSMNFAKNVFATAKETIVTGANLNLAFDGTSFPILTKEGRYPGKITYGDKIYNEDEAMQILNAISPLVDKSTLTTISKLNATEAPEIKINTIMVSDKGSQYATVEINLTGNSTASLKKFKIVRESDYKHNEPIKKETDKEGYTIVPDKFTLTLPINELPELQRAAISRDVIGVSVGDVVGDFNILGFESKVTNVYKDARQKNAPTIIEFDIKYLTSEQYPDEDGTIKQRSTIANFPYKYTTDSKVGYTELMKYIFQGIKEQQN